MKVFQLIMRANVSIILVLWPLLLLCVAASAGQHNSQEPKKLRVLIVRNSQSRRQVEDAAALSVDSSGFNAAGANQSNNSNDSHQSGKSLASLTLHQRQGASQTDGAAGNKSSNWSEELHMDRIKPTWFNVSTRFKINGTSIEQTYNTVPIEYVLRPAFDTPILLRTKLGIIEGVRSIQFNKHLYTFLGIPYARPPVDDLRFREPKPAQTWSGILQATRWAPFCVQPSMTLASKSSPVHVLSQIMSEDCLYLNVWTPTLKTSGATARPRPVMVWIHGGAFQYGGASVDENDGSALAIAGDVVVVTFNYRVSAFGFLNANNPAEAPNNVGLLDQRMALEWVQQNIKQFGGDPQQVTLFGESAGGHSVGLHMISPPSQQLFRRAILQSGVPISFLRSYDVNSDNRGTAFGDGVSSIMMAKRLKCYHSPTNNQTSDDSTETTDNDEPETSEQTEQQPILNNATIECMRQKSSLELLKALGTPGNSGFFPTGNDPKGFFPNGPIMDSFDPENLKLGPQKDFLIGINTDEGTFMLHYGMASLFPSRAEPKVSSMEDLKSAIENELKRAAKKNSSVSQTDLDSASGSQGGGAQAHLWKPLLRISSSVLENFMPKKNQNKTAATSDGELQLSKEAEFGRSVGTLITDIIFLCPARTLAKTLTSSGRNVYFYVYNHRSSQSQYHPWIGITHHDEVEFVFGRPLRLADVYSGADIEMSQRLIKSWSGFAYTGQMAAQKGVAWPKYDEEENHYMNLEPHRASVGRRYHDRFCNIYENVIAVHLEEH